MKTLRSRRMRGSVTMFMLLVALPIALMGLSMAGEWSSLLLVRRQASLVAEAAAMAAASSVLPDGTSFDLELAQQRVDALMERAISPVTAPSGTAYMLPAHRGETPFAVVTAGPRDLTVTVNFSTPPLPVVDFIRGLSGADDTQIYGQVSRNAGICRPEESPNGCRYPIPRG